MSFNGRRGGSHVSQYLVGLNQDQPEESVFIGDDDLERDLALFTNTQFYDFETGQNTDFQAPPVKPDVTTSVTEPASAISDDVVSPDALMCDFPGLDFSLQGDFNFGDFGSTYASPTIAAFPDTLGNLQPIQPNPQTAYPPVPQQHQQHHPQQHPQQHQQPHQQHQPGYVLPGTPRVGSVSSIAGEKRKAEAAHSPVRILSFEEQSRLAAEEDKRKRNTAASARFRIKKKQREQALEKSAKEMTEKVNALEARINALETENKWLKSLVTEKHGGKDDILKKLLKEFAAQEEANKKNNHNADSDSNDDSIHANGARDGTDSQASSVSGSSIDMVDDNGSKTTAKKKDY